MNCMKAERIHKFPDVLLGGKSKGFTTAITLMEGYLCNDEVHYIDRALRSREIILMVLNFSTPFFILVKL